MNRIVLCTNYGNVCLLEGFMIHKVDNFGTCMFSDIPFEVRLIIPKIRYSEHTNFVYLEVC